MERLKVVLKQEKVYIEFMGCSQRSLDARRFEDYFIKNNFAVVDHPKSAEHILFISCACRNLDENFAIKRIEELKRYRGRLILGGCLKAINKERLEKVFQGPVVETANVYEMERIFPHFKTKLSETPDANRLYPRNKLQILRLYLHSLRPGLNFFRSVKDYLGRKNTTKNWYVRVSWGCVKEKCTYCSIWKAIGELKSKRLEDCVKEFNEGIRKAYKDIFITADNLGAYGLDINLTFPDLLRDIVKIKGDFNIHLENLHPCWIIKYLEEIILLLRPGRITAALCPLQSGNDRVLSLMNRRHTIAQAKESFLRIREACPSIKLHTQIIIGFPTETELEFEETLNSIKEIGFNLVLLHVYSRRPNLQDRHLIDQEISPGVINRRMEKAEKFLNENKITHFIYSSK